MHFIKSFDKNPLHSTILVNLWYFCRVLFKAKAVTFDQLTFFCFWHALCVQLIIEVVILHGSSVNIKSIGTHISLWIKYQHERANSSPTTRGVTRGQGGNNSSGAASCGRRWITARSAAESQQCHIPQVFFSMQYACFRKSSGSNMAEPNLLHAQSAI